MHLKVVCNPPKNREKKKKMKATPSCPTSGELFETSPGCDRLFSSTFEASRNASQTSLLSPLRLTNPVIVLKLCDWMFECAPRVTPSVEQHLKWDGTTADCPKLDLNESTPPPPSPTPPPRPQNYTLTSSLSMARLYWEL
ncbi:hypothetical protein CesoFtcFv8_019560 [Champsocephalus esox]|uniref:Uncharacterized protein n=1 Tax=Champsocephalus esox TaxID=159716 RepID=A0AAN8BEE3_9TELE|nr:hypothetical protein CesoFtcFv8_019560 [Champsocephalus esox]